MNPDAYVTWCTMFSPGCFIANPLAVLLLTPGVKMFIIGIPILVRLCLFIEASRVLHQHTNHLDNNTAIPDQIGRQFSGDRHSQLHFREVEWPVFNHVSVKFRFKSPKNSMSAMLKSYLYVKDSISVSVKYGKEKCTTQLWVCVYPGCFTN